MTPVLNIDDAKAVTLDYGGSKRFGATISRVGAALGTAGLGCMYAKVEPGKRAFPFHNHHGNEEMFVILEGVGTYRLGDGEYPVKAGDICIAPAGGPETAHQIINTGDTTLRYLAISTRNDPDVVEYPDSGKFAALALGDGDSIMSARLRYVGRLESGVDYMDGEEL
ncbi:MAG: cupin domain-containing protein [Rubricella sp.]